MSNKRAEWVYLLVQAGLRNTFRDIRGSAPTVARSLKNKFCDNCFAKSRIRAILHLFGGIGPRLTGRERETKMRQDPLETFCARPETRPDFFDLDWP